MIGGNMNREEFIKFIQTETEVASIDFNQTIEECGLDSMDYMHIVLQIERKFNVIIKPNFKETRTVEDFFQYVNLKLQEKKES